MWIFYGSVTEPSSERATFLNWAVYMTLSCDLCQFAWLQCRTCQGPSHEQLQQTVDDIKVGRRWFCNSMLAEAEQCGSISFSESGMEWRGAWGETALSFDLRPGDIVLSHTVAGCHSKKKSWQILWYNSSLSWLDCFPSVCTSESCGKS